jgi:choline dehydrogenase-like flavoprotein
VSDTFDYIVIGSGSAGSLMANRLSADPANRVALIEAGPSDRQWPVNIKTAMPVGNIFLIPHARYNWKHTLSGNAQIGGRSINFPRGKLMGGCSAINGGVYIRGQREDYDAWERAGNGLGLQRCAAGLHGGRELRRGRQALAWQGRRAGCAEAALLQSHHPCHHRAAQQAGISATTISPGSDRPVSAPMISTSGAARACRARGPFSIRCSSAPI